MTRTCPLATHPRFSRLLPWPPLPLVPFSHPTPPVPQHSGKGSCLGEWQQLTQRKSSSMETYSLPNLLYPTCSPMAPHLCSGVRGTSSSRSKESKVGQSCGNSSSCSCSRACCLWGDKSQHRHRSVLFHRCQPCYWAAETPRKMARSGKEGPSSSTALTLQTLIWGRTTLQALCCLQMSRGQCPPHTLGTPRLLPF